jgi:NOL1/NOP2/fmu family ribosome biogenesis protein
MAKWGHPGTIITRTDPELIHSGEGLFDIVLVDAPCSGEGMFRKDPGAVEAWSTDAVIACAGRQKKLMQTAASLVAPGGLLIYSTCTWSEEEDEQVVNGLLSQGAFESFELPRYNGIVYNDSGAKFFPHLIQGEGFFVAALIKTSGEKFISKKKIRLPSHITKVSSIDYRGNEFLQHPSNLFKADQSLWCLPENYFDRWLYINSVFNVVSSGCRYGDIIGKDVHPSAELALSSLLNPTLPHLNVTEHEALRYLHGETLQIDPSFSGWQLVKFENHGLGWGKAVNGRLNNSYPKPWRIKMNIDNKISD